MVNLTEDEPTCSYNLPQPQKLACAHIIASCAQEKDFANIITFFLCAQWCNMDNYSKVYVLLFHRSS